MLSGFILCYVYSAGNEKFGLTEYRRFLWFRLARISPNHLAIITALIVFIAVAKHFWVSLTGDYPLSGLPFQITMTHAWPFLPDGKWNYPSWTISAEWFAYLGVFPVAWNMLKLRLANVFSMVVGYLFY